MIDLKRIDIKKICKKLLYPRVFVIVLLEIISTATLLASMILLGTEHVLSYIAYVFSAYALTTVCMRIPVIVRFFKRFKNTNKYIRQWINDANLRVKITLYATLIFNTVYAIFQLALGILDSSVWFYSLAVYYILLAVMRFFLLRGVNISGTGVNVEKEYVRYRFCGIILMFMNLALSGIVLYITRFNYGFKHHYIITIALAAYTFTVMAVAIVNVIKFRKFKRPVFSASKAISLAAACVSMLTLETTMLEAFGGSEDGQFRRIITAITGAAVCAFIFGIGVYMIIKSSMELKKIRRIGCDGHV